MALTIDSIFQGAIEDARDNLTPPTQFSALVEAGIRPLKKAYGQI